MRTTEQKLTDILSEINGGSGFTEISGKKMSMREVIDIMLNEESTYSSQSLPEQSRDDRGYSGKYFFDMKELEKWKNRNNECFEIHSYFGLRSHRRIIGRFIVFFKKIVRRLLKWYIDPIVEQENRFNGSVTAAINTLYNNEVVTEVFIHDYEGQLKNIFAKIEELKRQNEELTKEMLVMSSFRDTVHSRLDEIKSINDEIKNVNKKIASEKAFVENKINEIRGYAETTADYLAFKLYQKEKDTVLFDDMEKVVNNDKIEKQDADSYDMIDYFKFENNFRGLRSDIKNRQRKYLVYFEGKEKIIDIGCGRGEFLELLKENGISASGVDTYGDYVDYCRYKGVEAIRADGISYLKSQDDNSKGGIVAFQVVEHLQIEQIVALCEEAYRVLEDDSYLILETPNPVCLSIYCNWFYVDPSHIKPVHPKTLEYLLKEAGFREIKVIFTEDSKVDYRLPLLVGSQIDNLAEFNEGINLLSDLIFGSQDYAIIAKK